MRSNNGSRPLPVLQVKSTGYYVDLGNRQFRETMNPENRVEFDSVNGEELCRQAGVVTCLGCGMSVIIAGGEEGDGLHCMRCGRGV